MAIDGIGSKISAYSNIVKQPTPVKEVKPVETKDNSQIAAKEPERVTTETKPTGNNAPFEKQEGAEEKEALQAKKPVKNSIAEVNKKLNHSRRCEFSYHEETKRVSIKVIDSETDEVIREIPPEETLDMLTKMWEAAGILVDEQR